ncbi:MAG: hypothetical protein ACYC7I_01795 [Gammaproteobacteria bacterium]
MAEKERLSITKTVNSYKGQWTHQHQMSLNGKRDNFTKDDLIAVSEAIRLLKLEGVINDVVTAIERWPEFAKDAGINARTIKEISKNHRLKLTD